MNRDGGVILIWKRQVEKAQSKTGVLLGDE